MESSFEQGFKLRGIYKLFVAVVEFLNSYQAQIDAHITSGDNTGSRLRLPSFFHGKKADKQKWRTKKFYQSAFFPFKISSFSNLRAKFCELDSSSKLFNVYITLSTDGGFFEKLGA